MTSKIEQLEAAFEAHGYSVIAEAIEGQEELFANDLAQGFAKVETVLKNNAAQYGFRGLSKRALQALHKDLPNPAWGVEIRS